MDNNMINAFEDINDDSYVNAEEVLRLRREVFRNGVVDMTEAEELLSMADIMPMGDPEWPVFLTEALTDFFVRTSEPVGIISQKHASYVIGRMGAPEAVSTLKYKALVHMIDTAHSVSPALIEYAFDVSKAYIIRDGYVSAEEVDHLRVFLFAMGGDEGIRISKKEAELMFDINDAARGGNHAPEWAILFRQIVANYMMAHIGYEPLPRGRFLGSIEALTKAPSIWQTMKKITYKGMTKEGRKKIHQYVGVDGLYARQNSQRANDAEMAAVVTPEETNWLADRIGKGGVFDQTERGAVEHIRSLAKENGAELPEKLQKIVNEA